MFLEQPRPHFVPSSSPSAINLARKDTAIVFQRQYLLCIMFTAEYSKRSTINFLDVNIRLVGGAFMIDLFVKPTQTHQFLDPSSPHP